MKKAFARATAALMAMVIPFSFAACTEKVLDTEDVLEIYIQDLGYGTQWLEDEIALFKEQAWVKEKYPNLVIPDISYNSEYSYGANQIKAGKQANSVDLFFISADYDLQSAVDASGERYIADLNDVFNQNVPGEEILYKDKMFDEFEMSCQYDGTYWSTLWTCAYEGILYNADLFEELGLSVPRTTNELITLCRTVSDPNRTTKDAYDKTYTVMLSTSRTEAAYWQYMAFPTWWAQYEGLENYYNFYKGIDSVTGTLDSRDVFLQQGRRESLDVLYTLIHDYSFVGAGSIDFIEAQQRFLMGDGLIMANGDWFYEEMRTTVEGLKANGYDYDIRYMKTPIISSIVENLTTVTEESQLTALIDAIDGGVNVYADLPAALSYVSEADFDRVYEARTFVYTESYLHQAFVPSYATGKEVAKDFLRFLATDIAINQYMESTGGATLPFGYDVSEKDPELYESFDGIQKYRDEIYNSSENLTFVLPTRYEEFPLVYLGGMKSVPVGIIDSSFSQGGGKDAETFFNEQANYYSGSTWDDVLRNAGRK